PAAGAPPAERWDVPIQERLQQGQSGAQAPAPAAPQAPAAAPAAAAPTEERWDIPIQERMKMQAGGQQAPAAPQPSALEDQGSGLFKNLDDNAMDKLFSDNLGLKEAAGAAAVSRPAAAGAAPAPIAQAQAPSVQPA